MYPIPAFIKPAENYVTCIIYKYIDLFILPSAKRCTVSFSLDFGNFHVICEAFPTRSGRRKWLCLSVNIVVETIVVI